MNKKCFTWKANFPDFDTYALATYYSIHVHFANKRNIHTFSYLVLKLKFKKKLYLMS